MARFDDEQLEQINELLERQRSAIMVDTRTLLQQELRPIHDDLTWVKEKLARLSQHTDEDDRLALREIEALKKKVRILETRLLALER